MSDKYLNLLRSLPTTEHILNHDRRVQVFKGEDAYQLLYKYLEENELKNTTRIEGEQNTVTGHTPKKSYKSTQASKPDKSNLKSTQDSKPDKSNLKTAQISKTTQSNLKTTHLAQFVFKILNGFIASEHIVRCTVDKKSVILNLSKQFNRTDSFIWVEDTTSIVQTVLSICLLFCILALVLFQVWPSQIKSKASLILYPVLAFFIFIAILGVIRLIVFCITYLSHQPGIWLFPNLFADVGFIDSFIPVWSWHGEDVRHTKKED